jgi:soluble lytic murein transglycosylase-like protein
MKHLPDAIATLINAAAQRHGVQAALARAVAWIESGGDENAVSEKGAQGVMQLMPATAKSLGVTNPFNASQNIDAGVRYLGQLIKQFGDDQTALAAYNWGPGYVKKSGGQWPAQVTRYVAKVQARAIDEGYRTAAGPKSSDSPQLPVDCPSCGHSFDALAVAAAKRGMS